MNTNYPKDEVEKAKDRARDKAEREANYPNEEQTRSYPSLHIYGADDNDEHWSVWLNPDLMPDSGMCIGTGDTRDKAVEDAVNTMQTAINTLQGPRPIK